MADEQNQHQGWVLHIQATLFFIAAWTSVHVILSLGHLYRAVWGRVEFNKMTCYCCKNKT